MKKFLGRAGKGANGIAFAGAKIVSPISFIEFLWLTAVFLLPIFFWPSAYTTFELPKIVLFHGLTMAMLLVWIFKRGFGKVERAEEAKMNDSHASLQGRRGEVIPFIFLGLIIVSWVISMIFSVAPTISFFGYYPRFQGLYAFIMYIVFAIVVVSNISGNRQFARVQIDRILCAISLSALVNGVVALMQKIGFSPFNFLNTWDTAAFLGRPFGLMGHPDFLACLLVIAIPLTVYLILSDKYTLLSFAAFIVSISALFFTLSRAAFIGIFAGFFVFLFIYCIKTRSKKLLWSVIAAPFLIVGIVVFANLNAQNNFVSENTLLNRMVFSGENLRSIETRLALWPATIKQIFSRPFAGYGLDTYAISFPEFYPAELNTLENLGDYPDRAHNFILDYAVQNGIPEALIFVGFIVFVFWRAFHFIFKNAHSTNEWLLTSTLLSSLIAILIANFFGFFTTVTWAYFWLIVAIILFITNVRAHGEQPAKKESAARTSKTVGYIIFIPLLFAGIIIFYLNDYTLFRADLMYRNAYDGKADYALLAAETAPSFSFYWYKAVDSALEKRLNADADKYNESSGKITNYDGKYFLNRGRILHAINGSEVMAEIEEKAMFEHAIEMMPANPSVYLEYGTALYENGDYRRAVVTLEKYLTLCPSYYKWTNDFTSYTDAERERYRIFYKLNPDFNKVFDVLGAARAKMVDVEN